MTSDISVSSDMTSARADEVDAVRAALRLPGFDIELVRSRRPDGTSERISVTLQAVPSFAAFGRTMQTVDPIAFWTQAMQLAWLPWIETARMLQAAGATPRLAGRKGQAPAS